MHRKTAKGKMPERSIGTVSKTVVPLRVPRVRIPVFPLITTTNPLQIKLLRLILFLTHTKIHTNYRRNLIPYNVVGIIETQPHGQKFLVMSGGKIKFPDIFLTTTAERISSTDFAPHIGYFVLCPSTLFVRLSLSDNAVMVLSHVPF